MDKLKVNDSQTVKLFVKAWTRNVVQDFTHNKRGKHFQPRKSKERYSRMVRDTSSMDRENWHHWESEETTVILWPHSCEDLSQVLSFDNGFPLPRSDILSSRLLYWDIRRVWMSEGVSVHDVSYLSHWLIRGKRTLRGPNPWLLERRTLGGVKTRVVTDQLWTHLV